MESEWTPLGLHLDSGGIPLGLLGLLGLHLDSEQSNQSPMGRVGECKVQLNSSRPQESAHLTSETLLETLSEHDPNNPEWLPHTVKEALESDEKAEWRKAINDELEQLQGKCT